VPSRDACREVVRIGTVIRLIILPFHQKSRGSLKRKMGVGHLHVHFAKNERPIIIVDQSAELAD